MKSFSQYLAALVIAVGVIGAPANASLIIKLEVGPDIFTETNPSNTFEVLVHINPSGFVSTSLVGQDMLSGGALMDVSLNSVGIAEYTVTYTQTDIILSGDAIFNSLFSSNNIGSGVVVTRNLYLDPLNTGLESILLSSLVVGGGLNAVSLHSALQTLAGPFSLVEKIHVTGATSPGNSVSLDDTVHVPEPSTIVVLMGVLLSLFGFAAIRRQRAA